MIENPKIVLIDDDPNFLEIFSVSLGSAGMQVVTAQSGSEGIEKVKQVKPELVLCDMNMPGMNGADVIKEIKNDSETQNIKTVFLTNLGGAGDLSMENNISLAKDLGAIGYIMKSDEMSVIVEKVKSFLE